MHAAAAANTINLCYYKRMTYTRINNISIIVQKVYCLLCYYFFNGQDEIPATPVGAAPENLFLLSTYTIEPLENQLGSLGH